MLGAGWSVVVYEAVGFGGGGVGASVSGGERGGEVGLADGEEVGF